MRRVGNSDRSAAEHRLLAGLSTAVLRHQTFEELTSVLVESVRDYFDADYACIHLQDDDFPDQMRLVGASSGFWQNRGPRLNELQMLAFRQGDGALLLNHHDLQIAFSGRFSHRPAPQETNSASGEALSYLAVAMAVRNPVRRAASSIDTQGPNVYGIDASLEILFRGRSNQCDVADLDFLKVIGHLVEISLSNWTLYSRLQERQAFTEVVLNGMADGLLLVDSNSQIVSSNEAATSILGISANKLSSLRVDQALVLQNQDQVSPICLIDLYQPLGETRNFQVECQLFGRGRRHLSIQVTRPANSDALSKPFWVLVFRDVSQQKEMEDLRNDFIAMMSHELRTPLTGMKGYLKMLLHRKAREFDMDKIQGIVTIINHQADQLQRLIADLMEAAKIRNEALEIHPIVCDLIPLLRQAVASQALSGFEMSVSAPTSVMVSVDGSKYGDVLAQLLSNAAKYSLPGGKISLNCRVDQTSSKTVVVDVIDEGVGIPPEQLERIFDMFHRVDNSNSRVHYGVGLGLFLSRKILQAHGGNIVATSIMGCGSTFSVSLPFHPEIQTGSTERG